MQVADGDDALDTGPLVVADFARGGPGDAERSNQSKQAKSVHVTSRFFYSSAGLDSRPIIQYGGLPSRSCVDNDRTVRWSPLRADRIQDLRLLRLQSVP